MGYNIRYTNEGRCTFRSLAMPVLAVISYETTPIPLVKQVTKSNLFCPLYEHG